MYLVYNEFKSVIAQRLVVEQILPIEQVGEVTVAQAEEMGLKEKKRAIEAAKGAGVGMRPADTHEMDAAAAKFATAPVDYIYEQPPEELFRASAAEVCRHTDFSCACWSRLRPSTPPA